MKKDKNLLPWLFVSLTLLIAIAASIFLPKSFGGAFSLNGIDFTLDKVVLYYVPVAATLLMMAGGPWPFNDDAPKYKSWQLVAVLAVTAGQIAMIIFGMR
jgi:hypothetical protein